MTFQTPKISLPCHASPSHAKPRPAKPRRARPRLAASQAAVDFAAFISAQSEISLSISCAKPSDRGHISVSISTQS
jgi:hypothetical protein